MKNDRPFQDRLDEYEVEITERGLQLKNVEPLSGDEAFDWWAVARARLYKRHPFFGYLVSKLRFYEKRWLPAPAATDGFSFIYNPGLMPVMDNPKDTLFVLAHEIIHAAFLHPQRSHGKDHMVANVAADIVTNSLLEKTFGFCPDGVVRDEKGEFEGMTFEGVYRILYDRAQQMKSGQCPQCDGSGQGQGSEEDGGQDESKPEDNQDEQNDDSDRDDQGQGSCPVCGGSGQDQSWWEEMLKQQGGGRTLETHEPWEDAKGQSSEKRRQAEKDWEEAVSIAASVAKERGHIPAGLERWVEDLFEIDLPWETHVQRWLNRKVKAPRSTWSRPNRRHLSRGTIMPGRAKQQTGDLLVGVDTSGSMSDTELRYVLSSVKDLAETIPNLTIDLVALDTEIARDESGEPIRARLKRGDQIDLFMDRCGKVLRGGGGTRMEPLFELASEDGPYDAVICCTDGYNDWNEFRFDQSPTLWLVTVPENEAPWGMTVNIDPETLKTEGRAG